MKILKSQPSLTDQVYDAIVDQICEGALSAGSHLVQEQLAERLGVSRQPVQQAMALMSRFDNAHDSAMAASGQALFAEFDQCVHSSEVFPCKNWEHDIHWALSWSSVSADEDV